MKVRVLDEKDVGTFYALRMGADDTWKSVS